MREALKALEREGVMVAAHRRGYRLREFTEAEVDEIGALREQLEVLVARTLAGNHNAHDLAALTEVIRRQDADSDGKSMFALDEEFHLLAAERAGLPRTRKILEGLRSVMAAVTAGVSIPHSATAQRIAEHDQIVFEIAQGNADEAARLMSEHVKASHDTFREAIQAHVSAGPIIKPLDR